MFTDATPSPCGNCGAPDADPARRWLCPRCAADGAIRSCFRASDGKRIAEPSVPYREVPVYVAATALAPGVFAKPDDSRGWRGPTVLPSPSEATAAPAPSPPAARSQGRTSQLAADRADAALLRAVDDLLARGIGVGCRTADTGAPTVLRSLAAAEAGLGLLAARAAARRLVAAGVLEAVGVKTGKRGRLATGLRRRAGGEGARA